MKPILVLLIVALAGCSGVPTYTRNTPGGNGSHGSAHGTAHGTAGGHVGSASAARGGMGRGGVRK